MTMLDDDITAEAAVDEGKAIYGFALSGVPQPGPWWRHGACRSAPTSIFFTERGESQDPAKAICAGCGVRARCLDYALDAGAELKGIWGGAGQRERVLLRAERRAATTLPAPEPETASRKSTPPGQLLDKLKALTAHPDRWIRLATYSSHSSAAAVASLFRNGHRSKPTGRFEFEGRTVGDGSELYARYLGADR